MKDLIPLFRSTKNKMIGGVCGGFAEYFGVNPLAVRTLAVISIPFIGMISITFYLLAMSILPKDYS